MIEVKKKHYYMMDLTLVQKNVILTLNDYINRGGQKGVNKWIRMRK